MPRTPQLLYVVLHHQNVEDPHFDLLIERSHKGRVPTWRLPDWPIKGRTCALRLGDHRRMYLNYEGPVSGKRGTVRSVERGVHRTRRTRAHWRVQFVRHSSIMGLELKQIRGREWEVTPIDYAERFKTT